MNEIQLKILKPEGVFLDEPVVCVIAEALNGSFCLKPRHRDFATAIVPGIVEYRVADGSSTYAAVDEGLVVKSGFEVLIVTRDVVVSRDLEQLRETVVQQFEVLDDRERSARSAIVKLEADFVRRFLELGESPHV